MSEESRASEGLESASEGSLAGSLRSFLQRRSREDSEVEVRIGSLVNGRFLKGVDRDRFEAILNRLLDDDQVTLVQGFQFSRDVQFGSVRTSSWVESEQLRTLSVVKTMANRAEFSGPTFAAALTKSIEAPIATEPHAVVPKLTRGKVRCSFQLQDNCWRVDMTRVYSFPGPTGPTDLDNHMRQQQPPTHYEVELELADQEGPKKALEDLQASLNAMGLTGNLEPL